MQPSDVIARIREAANAPGPPVDAWNPPYGGDIDIRIARDGRWYHEGAPIGRIALVKLFASVLRREPDGRYVLVTPVESFGITVEDAPLLAVEMRREGAGHGQSLHFRTNLDDWTTAGPGRPLRFEHDEKGGLKPYVRVRGRLDALFTRALVPELVDIADETEVGGRTRFGVWSGGAFFAMDAGRTPP